MAKVKIQLNEFDIEVEYGGNFKEVEKILKEAAQKLIDAYIKKYHTEYTI